MLRELFIKNFAIIDDLHARFDDGITILSGETGAGKSIIIQAVNLLLGGRASAEMIRSGADSAELEAVFEIPSGSRTAEILKNQEMDPEEGLMVRRIISAANRHRIYINNRPATMRLLMDATENLASISGQHAHQRLLDESQHLVILDQFGGLMPLRARAADEVRAVVAILRESDRLRSLKARQAEQTELLLFQKNDIEKASISPGEDAALEQEIVRLKNGEALYQAVYEAVDAIYGAENAVIGRLSSVAKSLEKAGRIDPILLSEVSLITNASLELESTVERLRAYLEVLSMDPGRLTAADDRLTLLRRLKKKYGGSLESVLDHLSRIEQDLAAVSDMDDTLRRTEKDLESRRGRMIDAVRELSAARARAAALLGKKVEAELSDLNMAHTRFSVDLITTMAPDDAPSALTVDGNMVCETGMERAAFRIAPNPGEAPRPLSVIASGGELSRVILALKVILAETDAVGSIVFDEVDAGIGGGVAEIVGRKIASLAAFHQVVCITHLPQIAQFADHHYRIIKETAHGRTRTRMEPLTGDERVREIARMLGGVTVTPAALDHARDMLQNRRKN